MRILFINEVCGYTSTGKICVELAEKYESEGHEVKIAFGRDGYVPEKYKRFAIRIGTKLDVYAHAIYTRLTDKHGLGSRRATKAFLKWADIYNPDMIWLHNIHGYYINYELLFDWIKMHPEKEIKWTLHDCWAFTGHCTHYTYIKCNRWKTECSSCPQKKEYPSSVFVDNSKDNYVRKKGAFSGVNNMTIITPSQWLEKQVQQSFLQEYNIEVIHNEVDRNVFKPTPSDFRVRYGLENKTIILGVANVWNERKGLNDFNQLARKLDRKNYQIVLVGINKKQRKSVSSIILSFDKTKNQQELVEIYSEADVFLNLTFEDTFPTVNLEAEACGTPVITYDAGGAKETIRRADSVVVPAGQLELIVKAIEDLRN